MDIVLSVKMLDGRIIRLTIKQWKHIAFRHPEIAQKIHLIEAALTSPNYKKENGLVKYYKYLKEENKYLMVAVKMLNGEGFVVTCYTTRKTAK